MRLIICRDDAQPLCASSLTAVHPSTLTGPEGGGLAMPIVSFALMVAQVMGYAAGTEEWFGAGPWITWPVFVICLLFRPLGSVFISVVAFYGFTRGMGWEWWKALLIVAPGLVFTVVGLFITGIGSIFSGMRRA